jgi:hypothetical protein
MTGYTGPMLPFYLKIRKDQQAYLNQFKARGGNMNHFIRIAIDEKIERDSKKRHPVL